jgi:hypothetical protein
MKTVLRSFPTAFRQVPDPSARQKQLLDALKLQLPVTVPEAEVIVGTRKPLEK